MILLFAHVFVCLMFVIECDPHEWNKEVLDLTDYGAR